MADYPDWTRLFHLVGTSITLDVNIEGSDVAFDVNLVAATATIDVNLESSDVTLPISIAAATVTVDVNLAAQVANIDFNFADQAVAVFDAAKWFSHQAKQWFAWGSASVDNNSGALVERRTVPTGKVAFVTGMGWSGWWEDGLPEATSCTIWLGVAQLVEIGSIVGHGITFDSPLRFTAGQHIDLWLYQMRSTGTRTMYGSLWGYDEEA